MTNDKKHKNEDFVEEIEEEKVLKVDDECAKIKEENVHLQEKVTELESQVKRVLADYQNAEKRTREEKSEWIRIANKELLLRLLPVLDTIVLAAKHSDDKTLGVTLQQFLGVLASEGVKRIQTEEKTFDPKTMECIAVVQGKNNTVLEELRAGFLLHDKVLRPAQVKVGKEE